MKEPLSVGHKNNPACIGADKKGNLCPLRGVCARFQIIVFPPAVSFEWAPFRVINNVTKCSYRLEKAESIDTQSDDVKPCKN
jgi:hypothetical protein